MVGLITLCLLTSFTAVSTSLCLMAPKKSSGGGRGRGGKGDKGGKAPKGGKGGKGTPQAIEDTPGVESAADRKKKQSNMLAQMHAANRRLEAHLAGTKRVPDSEVEVLQARVDFWKEYTSCDHKSSKKHEMLQAWENDKSCKTWGTYKRTFEVEHGTTWERSLEYGTKLFGCIC
jgi:hypothetical protein